MDVLLWIIFGALSGWLASIIVRTRDQQGFLMDIVLGIVGAVVGGFIMNIFGQPGITGFNLYNIIVAVIGAVVLITVGRTLASTRY